MVDFLRAGSVAPERVALREAGRVWSYGELDAWVSRLAAGLAAVVPAHGARVAVVMEGGAPQVAALHSVARAGYVLAPLSARLTAAELASALRTLGVAAVLTHSSTADLARRALQISGVRAFLLDVSDIEKRSGEADTAVRRPLAAGGEMPRVESAEGAGGSSDEWAVVWTSGTQGRPRGVTLSAGNLVASAVGSRERLALSPDDRWHLAISAAHVGGLALVTRAALLRSAVVPGGAFSASRFNALVDAGEVTHASVVPTMLHRIMEERGRRPAPSTLACVLVGGARTPPELLARALTLGFPVALTYGLTEACSQVATAAPGLVRRKPGTVGPPLPGVHVRVADDGEILVKGPIVAARYVGHDLPVTDSDGWLHTGDLGELDAEGHLSVTGRRSDRIVTGGVTVDPAEVEDVLRLHEGVGDVSVVGLGDPEWGELVAAAVVRRPGFYPEPEALKTLARERLTSAKIPRRFLFLDALPLGPNGKTDRAAVRRLLEGS